MYSINEPAASFVFSVASAANVFTSCCVSGVSESRMNCQSPGFPRFAVGTVSSFRCTDIVSASKNFSIASAPTSRAATGRIRIVLTPSASATVAWTRSPVINVAFSLTAVSRIRSSISPTRAPLILSTVGREPWNSNFIFPSTARVWRVLISSRPRKPSA